MGVLPARMGYITLGQRPAHRYGAKPHFGTKKGKRGVAGFSIWDARGQIVQRGEVDRCLSSRSRLSPLSPATNPPLLGCWMPTMRRI